MDEKTHTEEVDFVPVKKEVDSVSPSSSIDLDVVVASSDLQHPTIETLDVQFQNLGLQENEKVEVIEKDEEVKVLEKAEEVEVIEKAEEVEVIEKAEEVEVIGKAVEVQGIDNENKEVEVIDNENGEVEVKEAEVIGNGNKVDVGWGSENEEDIVIDKQNGEDYGEIDNANLDQNWEEDENPENLEENQEGEIVGGEGKEKRLQFPFRPGEPDCTYYLRTGTCRYGFNCRFNHPIRKKKQVRSPAISAERDQGDQVVNDKEEYPERTGQQECKYYLRTGGCKFGKACRYDHPREKNVNELPAELNFLGLPIRPGERECPFYMRTGSCKFATSCRFHHPDPTAARIPDSGYNQSVSVPLRSSVEPQPAVTSWSLPRPSNAPAPYLDASPSYVPVMLSPPQGMHSSLEWNGYQAPPLRPLYPPKGNVGPPMTLVMNDSPRSSEAFMHHVPQMAVEEFPERPGQKECQYFLKTGDCKYRSACRFHHPKNRGPKPLSLSPSGLPLRPDQIICTHYSRFGICKYGAACKYDHPPNYATPAYPVGSMSGPPMPFGGPRMADDGSKNLVQQSV